MDFMVGKGTPDEDYEDEVLDFTDGPRRTASGDRSVVRSLKAVLDGVADGSRPRSALVDYIRQVSDGLRKAVVQCAVEAGNYPDRAEYFHQSARAYQDCLEAVTSMLEVDSAAVQDSLFGVFQSAANRLEELLAEEKALEAGQG